MKLTTGNLKKILAALIASPVIVALAQLPAPYGPILGGIVAVIGVYVNWGHKDQP